MAFAMIDRSLPCQSDTAMLRTSITFLKNVFYWCFIWLHNKSSNPLLVRLGYQRLPKGFEVLKHNRHRALS